MTTPQQLPLFDRISVILDSAHTQAARSVNTVQVVANGLIGREIVEEQQKGQSRAKYGDRLIPALSRRLTAAYGSGYTVSNLAAFREFYTAYSTLLEILHMARKKSTNIGPSATTTILHAARVKSESSASANETVRPTQPDNELREAVVIVAQLRNERTLYPSLFPFSLPQECADFDPRAGLADDAPKLPRRTPGRGAGFGVVASRYLSAGVDHSD